MAYETFIPTVWNEKLNRELTPKLVLAKNVNREYEGEVKQKGDSVRILNVGRPTIYSETTDNKSTLHSNINAPEEIDNSSITMPIKQIRYYNYFVGDIDKVQMMNDGKVMAAYQKETSDGLALEIDKYIGQTIFPTAPVFTNAYSNATNKYIKVSSGTSAAAAADAAQNVLELLDDIIEKARINDIPDSETIYVSVSPKVEKIIRRALIAVSTDNVDIIEGKGYLKYYNLRIDWSNNVKKVAANGGVAAYEYITARTSNAVAFVHPFTHAEPYRPEKGFADAIKGFILFDGMVTRPKEIFNVLVTF
jgi:hypothetical protein